jgi:hypothetical protein
MGPNPISKKPFFNISKAQDKVAMNTAGRDVLKEIKRYML